MGRDKWVDVEKRVSKEYAIAMFNFKDGLKQKMLKVQYFKHPDIAHHLYDRFFATYGIFPWNDEVPHYFAIIFYIEFFLNMNPYYIDMSKFYGVGKCRTYEQEGAFHDPLFPKATPCLVPHPQRLDTLQSDMEQPLRLV